MNLVLFEEDELNGLLPRDDPRAQHVLGVLRRREGEVFDAGIVDGPIGKASVQTMEDGALRISFEPGELPPPLMPLRLLVGLPRPQTARKVIQEACTLGVSELHFVTTERGEPSYAQSTLWSSGEWRRHALAGVAQAFCTRLPRITWGRSLAGELEATPLEGARLALDNYESQDSLGSLEAPGLPVTLVIGCERGWSASERSLLRASGCHFAHLGVRVLRVETAVTASVSILLSKLGRM